MAVTFPITGVTTNYNSSRSPTFTLGTAPAADDIVVVYLSTTSDVSMTAPSGWTNVLGSNIVTMPADTSNAGVMLYHRVTANEASNSVVTWTFTDMWSVVKRGRTTVTVLRGVATSSELVGTASGNSADPAATPWVIPTVTPTATGCQIIAGVSGDLEGTQTTPASHTLLAGAGTGQSNYLYADDDLGTDGVATGTTNVTPSAADEYVSIVACFAEAAAVTTTGTASGSIAVVGAASAANFTTKLRHGATLVDAVYVGTDLVDRIYHGSTRVL